MKNRLINLSFIVLATVLFTGCLGEEKKPSGKSGMPQMPPPTVQIGVVSAQNIPLSLHYPARLVSAHEVLVISKVAGTLEKQYFKEGDKVEKGALLYEIDPSVYEARYKQALSAVGVQESVLKTATRTWERVQSLKKSNAISQQDYDNALGAYENARAALEAAKASAKLAKIDLEDASVEATIGGVIGETKVDVGNYISGANTPLVTITQLDPIQVEFSLPQRDYFTLKPSMDSIKLRLEGPNGESAIGKVIYTDAKLNAQTATLTLKGSFENSANLWIPGLFVRVYLEGATLENAIAIPQKALVQDPSGTYVYVLKEGKAQRIPVSLGQSNNGMFIIESGLEGGEQIILDNLTKLRPNMPVNVAKG